VQKRREDNRGYQRPPAACREWWNERYRRVRFASRGAVRPPQRFRHAICLSYARLLIRRKVAYALQQRHYLRCACHTHGSRCYRRPSRVLYKSAAGTRPEQFDAAPAATRARYRRRRACGGKCVGVWCAAEYVDRRANYLVPFGVKMSDSRGALRAARVTAQRTRHLQRKACVIARTARCAVRAEKCYATAAIHEEATVRQQKKNVQRRKRHARRNAGNATARYPVSAIGQRFTARLCASATRTSSASYARSTRVASSSARLPQPFCPEDSGVRVHGA